MAELPLAFDEMKGLVPMRRHNTRRGLVPGHSINLVGIDRAHPSDGFNIRPDEHIIRIVKLLARQKAEEDFARAAGKKSH